MKLNDALRILKERESKSLRQGYRGDAASYAFKRYTLMFLNEIVEILKAKSRVPKSKKKRKPSEWNLFAAEYLKQGKNIKEAAEDWKKKKEE